jgi:hypothetical protein
VANSRSWHATRFCSTSRLTASSSGQPTAGFAQALWLLWCRRCLPLMSNVRRLAHLHARSCGSVLKLCQFGGSQRVVRAARPLASGEPPRFASGCFAWRSLRPDGRVLFWRCAECSVEPQVGRVRMLRACSVRPAVRAAHRLRCSQATAGTSLRLVPARASEPTRFAIEMAC